MVKIYTAEKAAAVFKRSSNSNNDSNNPDSLNGSVSDWTPYAVLLKYHQIKIVILNILDSSINVSVQYTLVVEEQDEPEFSCLQI